MAADPKSSATRTTLLAGVGIIVLLGVFLASCGSPRACGDYDRIHTGSGFVYEYDPNDGDYDRVNGDYVYVGCDEGRRSSSTSGGGWVSGGGSSNRGGGPGFGK